MRKLAVILGGVAVVAAGGWTALWFLGKGALERQIELGLTVLATRGYEVSHAGREIAGFPLGYRVTHRKVRLHDRASGADYALPVVVSEAAVTDPDNVVTYLPEKFTVDLPVAPGGATQRIEVEAQDMRLGIGGILGGDLTATLTAGSALAVWAGPDQPFSVALELAGLDSRIVLPPGAGGGTVTSATTVVRFSYIYNGHTAEGVAVTLEGGGDDLRLTGRHGFPGGSGLEAALRGAAQVSLAWQTGAAETILRADSGRPGEGGTIRLESASTAGTLALAGGVIDLATSGKAGGVTVLPGANPAADAPRLSAGLRAVEAIYKAPLAPSDAMAPMLLRVALDGVAPDAALWHLLDPDGTLPRDPARLIVDIEGSGRLTKQLTQMRPGEAIPLEIGNLSVRALDLSGLGASLTTRGDVEFLQPLNLPVGNVTLRMVNALALARHLAEHGLMSPGLYQSAAVMSGIYTRPGTEPGERVSEIAMGSDGISVNGRPLQAGN